MIKLEPYIQKLISEEPMEIRHTVKNKRFLYDHRGVKKVKSITKAITVLNNQQEILSTVKWLYFYNNISSNKWFFL